jgi:5-methylthioribose kinase
MSAEAFDITNPDAVTAYLRCRAHIAPDEPVRVDVLAVSTCNRLVRVERATVAGNDCAEAWVLKQALPRQQVPGAWCSDAGHIGREAEALRWLPQLAPPGTIAPLIFEDPERNLLAMADIPRPHQNWKTMLLEGRVDPAHGGQFGAILATIHRRAAEWPAPSPLPQVFADRSFFEATRLERYYDHTASQVPAARDFMEALADESWNRRLTLVHGDYGPKNLLILPADPGGGGGDRSEPGAEGVVLLGHELLHWGDPAFDVGFALAHLLSLANHLSARRGALRDAAVQFCTTYADTLGPALRDAASEPLAVRHTLGCLLAHVAGRAPLTYLTPAEQQSQQQAVLSLMLQPPATLGELIQAFIAAIGRAS